MREFYIMEIGKWENYGGKQAWQFTEGRYNEVLLYTRGFLCCSWH